MSKIELLRALSEANREDLNRCDNSFLVTEVLRIQAAGDVTRPFTYAFEPVAPYTKRYDPEVYNPDEYVERGDRAAWLAYVEGRIAGQILVHENWNKLAIVWDLVVDPPFRRIGVGRQLMRQAIGWARQRGLPGVMLETQNINAAGCRLYESCGFVLGGVDRYLYAATLPGSGEIALFWYLFF